jgi:transcriptional regulator with XRE-family HTH domain
LGQHLKKRRRELGLLQREAAERMGVQRDTYINWETGKTAPVTAQFRPVVEFLGYDPTPVPKNLAERLEAKRRDLGVTFEQAAKYLGWDPGSLTRHLNGTWALSPTSAEALERLLAMDERAAEALKKTPRRVR